ncbi:unnamed protein product [Rhodiola kirilowii]
MAVSCFPAIRLRKHKEKPLPTPSTSVSQFDRNHNTMERKRFDSVESWSMILDTDNLDSWEASEEDKHEWTADLSQLFIGNKFASGAHSRIYRGIYKQRAVAVKMVRIPNQNEETRICLSNSLSLKLPCFHGCFIPILFSSSQLVENRLCTAS